MEPWKQRNKKYSIIAGIGFFLVLLIVLANITVYQTYENRAYGFSIKYPADWVISENQNGTVVVFNSRAENALDIFSENVNVVVQNAPGDMTLEKYSQDAAKQVQAVFGTNLQVEEMEPTTLAGLPAGRFVYIGKGEEADIKMMHIWALNEGKAYQITFAALATDFDKYLPVALKMIRSFKILGPPDNEGSPTD